MVDINQTTSIGSLWTGPALNANPGTRVKETSGSFGEWLDRSIAQVGTMQAQADSAAEKLVTGENKDIHGTMIALQKAGVAMDLMLEVRNKVIAAYEEIKRMQF